MSFDGLGAGCRSGEILVTKSEHSDRIHKPRTGGGFGVLVLEVIASRRVAWPEACSDFVTSTRARKDSVCVLVHKKGCDSDMIPGNFLEAGPCSQQEKACAPCAKNSG